MKIAFLGTRGIPARYSGFETFVEQLASRLAARGHDVVVYGRKKFADAGDVVGVKSIILPSVRGKHLETISHTFLSTLHCAAERPDVIYYCIVGNAPLVWIPRVFGVPTFLNVDGEDFARRKWGAFARWYQQCCERIAGAVASVVIADARVIQRRYQKLYDVSSVFVPYGGNVRHTPAGKTLASFGLEPLKYYLYVGRLVPDNSVEDAIRAHAASGVAEKLVILGDSEYQDEYKRFLRSIASDSVVFTGYQFGDSYAELSSNALSCLQPSRIDGTRPALLDQLGFGNCIIARDGLANREVLADAALFYGDREPISELAELLVRVSSDASIADAVKARSHSRIEQFYNWDRITDHYERLFMDAVSGKKELTSYAIQAAMKATEGVR